MKAATITISATAGCQATAAKVAAAATWIQAAASRATGPTSSSRSWTRPSAAGVVAERPRYTAEPRTTPKVRPMAMACRGLVVSTANVMVRKIPAVMM